MTREDLYDRFYAHAQELIARHNPCQLREENGEIRCRDGYPCCSGCRHLGPSGCTVQSIACKFFLCSTAIRSAPQLAQGLDALKMEAFEAHVPFGFRMSKEENFSVWRS